MPAAATIGHFHQCPQMNPGSPPTPHIGGPVSTGADSVLINGMPAARMGDSAACNGPIDKVATGSSTVFIESQPAARVGDYTAHGGMLVAGSVNVIIG